MKRRDPDVLVLILLTVFLLVGDWFTGKLVEGELWDDPGFEDEPANTDPLSEADDRMREIKIEARRRLEVEHWVGAVGAPPGDDDNGLHRAGSARIFLETAAPTALDGGVGDYDSILETEQAETDLDNSASNSGGAIADDVGHGRLWADTDSTPTNQLYTYIGVAGDANGAWDEVSIVTGHADDEVLAGSYNLVFNGSFEATDGTGDATSTTVPSGWSATGGPTIGYTDPSGDSFWGDGYHLDVTDSGTGGDYVSQSSVYVGATVYRVLARVVSDGASTCRLSTSGASVESGNQDTTSATWVTLSGTFTTLDPDTVEIRLTTVTAAAVCSWDHVNVYRIGDVTTDRDVVSNTDMPAMYDTYTTVGVAVPDALGTSDVPGLSLTFNPPTSGWVLQVGYEVSSGDLNNSALLICHLKVGGVAITGTEHGNSGDRDGATMYATVSGSYINVDPTPGTPLVYTVDCTDLGANLVFNYNNQESNLWLLPLPPR